MPLSTINDREFKPVIDRAKNDADVLAVALFGSSTRGKGRDFDICVFLNKNLSSLEMSRKRLAFLSGPGPRFDVHIFQQLPLYIRARILKEGNILFCRNTDALYLLYFETIKSFNLYEKIYRTYLRAIHDG